MITAFQDLEFHHPVWLSTIPLSLIVVWIWLLLDTSSLQRLNALLPFRHRDSFLHPGAARLHEASSRRAQPSVSLARLWWGVLLSIVVGCFHAALAHPYRLGERLPDPPQYRDVVFMVDASVTTLLRDYVVDNTRVDRLTMLKTVLSHFVQQLHGNRIGITVFSEQAYTLVPLTADYALLQAQLQRLQWSLTGRTTDISKAILHSVWAHRDAPLGTSQDKPVLILISDVNRPRRNIDPRAAASYAAQSGFTLHVIAIGAASADAEEDDAYTLIYEPANFELLQAIAQEGGGQFIWAQDTASMRDAVAAIQRSAVRTVEVEPRYISLPLYQWPLGIGLLVLTLMQILMIIRRPRRHVDA
jgi:Ca-activated chloride channel family protein